jgi:hypothetical protein
MKEDTMKLNNIIATMELQLQTSMQKGDDGGSGGNESIKIMMEEREKIRIQNETEIEMKLTDGKYLKVLIV